MERPGSKQRLNAQQGLAIRQYINRCDLLGIPALYLQVKSAIQRILDIDDPSGNAPPLGKSFITRWLARNPDCRRVKQKPQELSRVAQNTEGVYTQHFEALHEGINDYSKQAADIYNMDKTRFRIGYGGNQQIITFDWQRQ